MSLYDTNRTTRPDNARNTDKNKHQIIRAMVERQKAAQEQAATVSSREAANQNNSPANKITLKNPRWIHIDENHRANREFKAKFKDRIILRVDQTNADGQDITFKVNDNNIPPNIDPEQLVKTITTKADGPIVDVEWEVSDPRSKKNKDRDMEVYFIASCDEVHSVNCDIEIADILQVHILEMEDTLFNHSSSMILPCGVTTEDPDDDYPHSKKDQDTISGLEVMKSTFEFLYYERKNERPKRLLLMGHSDPSGDNDYNKKLSTLRANTVQYLLMGDDKKNDWVEQFKKDKKDGIRTRKDRDLQEIINWATTLPFPKDEETNEKPFNYDLIVVDDKFGDKSKAALKGFQKGYNKAFEKDITVDGEVGKQVAEAIFDIYQWELNRIITQNFAKEDESETTPTIDELRQQLHWGNLNNSPEEAILSCGENWPLKETNPPSNDSYRSLKDRRVELLFLDEGAESKTELCTPETCSKENCPVYKTGDINKEYLVVNPRLDEMPFKMKIENNCEPIKEAQYTLTINHSAGKPIEIKGKVKEEDNSIINTSIPKIASSGTLEVTVNRDISFTVPVEFMELTNFGVSEDYDKVAAQQRLIGLGYFEPKEEDTEESDNEQNNDSLELALMRFKEDKELTLNSELNDETIGKIQELFGC